MPRTIELSKEGAVGVEQILRKGREIGATDIDVRPGVTVDYIVLDEVVHSDVLADEALLQEMEAFVDVKPAMKLTVDGFHPDDRGVARGAKTLDDGWRIRVHRYPTSNPNGVSFALRFLQRNPPGRHEIGVPEPFYQRIKQAKGGLFAVTGATGSGKTTTLNSCAVSIAEESAKKIVMLDQPIEYELSDKGLLGSITQTEIPTDYQDGASALETFMRIRPHYIFVGEVTSVAMMTLVLQLAESGHVVGISTHTDDAPETIGKIASFFPLDQQPSVYHILARKLIATMSQRLVVNEDRTGFVMIPDLMLASPAIQKMIMDQNLAGISQQMSHDEKQLPLNRSLYEAVFDRRLISLEAAVAACDDRQAFADFCEQRGNKVPDEVLDAV